jgi:hypothetical protein
MTQYVRPMNVHVAQGSIAERIVRARAGLPGGQPAEPEAQVPGMPSTPRHDLHNHLGKTIQNLTFTNFYVGGINSWNQSDIRSIDVALVAAMSDQSLNNVMMQYFNNQPITSTFKPSQILPGSAPSLISQGDLENLVQQLYTEGELNNFDFGSTVFNFMLPRGTVLTDNPAPGQEKEHHESIHSNPVPHEEEVSSLHGLGGYHGSIHVTATDGTQQTIYYAVGVYSEKRADGTSNGIPVFDAPWKNVVSTFYHELNEARTDPEVEDAIRAGNDPSATSFLGWTSHQGEECGDFPVFEAKPLSEVFQEVNLTNQSGTVPVQFQYSNAVHGPEGPIPNPH